MLLDPNIVYMTFTGFIFFCILFVTHKPSVSPRTLMSIRNSLRCENSSQGASFYTMGFNETAQFETKVPLFVSICPCPVMRGQSYAPNGGIN